MALIVVISYILVFLLGLSIYNVIKHKKWFLYSSIALIVLTIFVFFIPGIYGAYIWMENTFTTEMRVYAGPLPFNQLTIERGKVKKYGPLVIDVMRNERTERLESIFSDINTNDWILTTIFITPVGSHWESNPVFLFLEDSQMQKLEMIDKKHINYLFEKKINENKVSEIFEAEDPIYEEFWKYIYDTDSVRNNEEKLNILYAQIDSLISKENK